MRFTSQNYYYKYVKNFVTTQNKPTREIHAKEVNTNLGGKQGYSGQALLMIYESEYKQVYKATNHCECG